MKAQPVDSVVRVGEGGRGFVIEYEQRLKLSPLPRSLRSSGMQLPKEITRRVIVTAAHCLPNLPPAHAASYTQDRTYANLLGSLGSQKPNIWAECLFVDPVADIALLAGPDGQVLSDESDSYETFVEAAAALRIGRARSGPGWMLALDGHWIPSRLKVDLCLGGASLSIDPTEPGMSGSPILNRNGLAVGVVVLGEGIGSPGGPLTNERAGGQPILMNRLPGWLLAEVK